MNNQFEGLLFLSSLIFSFFCLVYSKKSLKLVSSVLNLHKSAKIFLHLYRYCSTVYFGSGATEVFFVISLELRHRARTTSDTWSTSSWAM